MAIGWSRLVIFGLSFVLLLLVLLSFIVVQPTGRGSTAKQTAADVNCPELIPPTSGPEAGLPQGNLKVASNTRWQPVGGDIHFTLTELTSQPQTINVWFRWQDGEGACIQSTRVQFISKSSSLGDSRTIEYSYTARLPPKLDTGAAKMPWIQGLHHRTFPSAVPLADMYVHLNLKDDKGADTAILTVGCVGVSTPWTAFVISIVLVGLAWAFLLSWADARHLPGSWLLRVISTPYGVASLSQFQIAIWTTTIGAGIIYVMMISGNLIDIPATTLGLLGVTGLTLVGSKVQANSDGTPQRLRSPGMVANLTVAGSPTNNTVVLNWIPPAGADQPFTYTVQARLSLATGPWITIVTEVGAPPCVVSGLTAGTAYDFQVFAINSGGPGPASLAVSTVTAAAPAVAVAAPGAVTGLMATPNSNGTVSLQWDALIPAPTGYVVQYRKAGNPLWAAYENTSINRTDVMGLESGTRYEFQVFAITAGAAGAPSVAALVTTAFRTPQWSDLVMSGDSNVEIDLTRVQMLLFTSISAAFTGMTLIGTGEIPDIPLGVLALVGLSNGIYLASKTVAQKP
jgi:hypothetical protein